MQHGYSGQLLDRAFLRLLPDVFFHPVWIHFIEANAPLSPDQIQSLLDAGNELLAANNLVEACQTLFICAFQQMHAGDYGAASSNIQRILILAEQHGLLHVACWATWGAAAVCVRRGWFQHAAEHLEYLQSLLGQQQEWVLSDVIDIIRRALLSQTQAEVATGKTMSSDAVLSSAFEQMLHWGTPHTASGINSDDLVSCGHPGRRATVPPGSTGFTWRSLWSSIKRIANGQLQLKWVATNRSEALLDPDESNALLMASPIVVAAPPPPPMPLCLDRPPPQNQQPETDRPLTSTQDREPAAIRPVAPDQPENAAELPAPLLITAYLLGTFSFSMNGATVPSWPSGKGRTLFKYLLAHHNQRIPRDVLMDVFWPQAGPEAARNSLNVALHSLRQALKTVTDKQVVLFEEGTYCLNPEFDVWIDVDEFERYVQAGRRFETKEQPACAVAEYEVAVELYQGDFLSGDPYEEWPVLTRERLRVTYLETLDHLSQIYFDRKQYSACITTCQQILARDNCREDAYCRLMQCYCRQGQHHLALRQYQTCIEALRTELDVDPAATTTQLYERIRRREAM